MLDFENTAFNLSLVQKLRCFHTLVASPLVKRITFSQTPGLLRGVYFVGGGSMRAYLVMLRCAPLSVLKDHS